MKLQEAKNTYVIRWTSGRFGKPVSIEIRLVRDMSAVLKTSKGRGGRKLRFSLSSLAPPFNIAHGSTSCRP